MTDPKEMRLLRQKMNEERKDEMKNRISMALKDPILQQGFEIICKNLTELKKENAELKVLLDCKNCSELSEEECEVCAEASHFKCKGKAQLAQAKELLKEVTQKYKLRTSGEKFADYQLIEQAEQFLKEAGK